MNEEETSTNTEQQSSAGAAVFSDGAPGGSQETQAPVVPAVETPAALTPEQLREIVSSTASEAFRAAQPQQQPLSQEQVNKMLNVFQVTPEHAQRLLRALRIEDTDGVAANEVVGLFNELLEAKTKQAVTMAAVQLEALRRNELTGLRQQLAPVMQYAQQQQETQLRQEFLTKYPDMQGWEPLLEAVYAQLIQERFSPKSKEDAFTKIYDRAKTVLAKLPGGQGSNNGQPQRTTQGGATRQMSTVSTGGQMGGSPQKATPAAEKLARGLFGGS